MDPRLEKEIVKPYKQLENVLDELVQFRNEYSDSVKKYEELEIAEQAKYYEGVVKGIELAIARIGREFLIK